MVNKYYPGEYHPDIKPGEFWFNNIDTDTDTDMVENLVWKTKRIGNTAYNDEGELLPPPLKPVFVMKSEVIQAGKWDLMDESQKQSYLPAIGV